MKRKPKENAYVGLSFSIPREMEAPMNQAAAARGMNRSQYIAWLVQQDIYYQRAQPPLPSGILPQVPPRIRRGRLAPLRLRRKPKAS